MDISKLLSNQEEDASGPGVRKKSTWSSEEDETVIKLRGKGQTWDKISKEMTGRSSTSCRLRYQNYLEKKTEWTETELANLAELYSRYVG